MHSPVTQFVLALLSAGLVLAWGEGARPSISYHWGNSSGTLDHSTYSSLLTQYSSSTGPILSPTSSSAPPTVTHNVFVGAEGMLAFKPDKIKALVNDVIEFELSSLNYTLTQSTSQQPCITSGTIGAGFNQLNPKNISGKYLIRFRVTTSDPQWFFYARTIKKSYCEAGMVFSLNTNSTTKNIPSSANISITSITTIWSTSETMDIPCTVTDSGVNSSTWKYAGSSITSTFANSTSTWNNTGSSVTNFPLNSTRVNTGTAIKSAPTHISGATSRFPLTVALWSIFALELIKFSNF